MLYMPAYQFDTGIATHYGVNEAIMIWNLAFWIRKNKANGRHVHETTIIDDSGDSVVVERTWTYNSCTAFAELFPFWNDRQIRHLLNKMIGDGILLSDNFNSPKVDRTKWYAFRHEDIMLDACTPCATSGTPSTKSVKSCATSGTPIPDSKQQIENTHRDTPYIPPSGDEQFERCWEQFRKRGSLEAAKRHWMKLSRTNRDAIEASIGSYMRCIDAGRWQRGFGPWLADRLWEMNWEEEYSDILARSPEFQEQKETYRHMKLCLNAAEWAEWKAKNSELCERVEATIPQTKETGE